VNELMLFDKFQQVLIPSDFKNGITGHIFTLVSQSKGVAILNIGCFRIMPADSSIWTLSVADRPQSVM
jgi:hypothetical protein